jgi:hypothetical protein
MNYIITCSHCQWEAVTSIDNFKTYQGAYPVTLVGRSTIPFDAGATKFRGQVIALPTLICPTCDHVLSVCKQIELKRKGPDDSSKT